MRRKEDRHPPMCKLKKKDTGIDMTDLKHHLNSSEASLTTLFTNRFSRHPDRYIEIVRVLRKYELHHVAAKFMLSHRHEEEEEDTLLLDGHEEDDDHAEGLAKALEETG